MSTIITYPLPAGPNYTIPAVGELNWGQEVTNFLTAIPSGTVPTAGTFALTGDLSFGTSFLVFLQSILLLFPPISPIPDLPVWQRPIPSHGETTQMTEI